MTRLHYISPSVFPSHSANSVHVLHQCQGLIHSGILISLYAMRSVASVEDLPVEIQRCYGIDVKGWDLCTFHSNSSRAVTVRIALFSLWRVLRAPRSDLVLSRNLYAAWILATFRRPLLFETHQLEYGIRKLFQRWTMTKAWVRTIVISDRLVSCLEEHHSIKLNNPVVLHDAAPDGIQRLEPKVRRHHLSNLLKIPLNDLEKWNIVCGYFGQMYEGRGIEIIESIAAARPSSLFMVFGGSARDVAVKRVNAPPNLLFMGYVPHQFALSIQQSVDVLLMPYQTCVSIGVSGQDTARWMSPMKMFEYLAAGVPIISSDLPVLKEILCDSKNALLVSPGSIDEWISALDSLIINHDMADLIGKTAHRQYLARHTWKRRAESILFVFGIQ